MLGSIQLGQNCPDLVSLNEDARGVIGFITNEAHQAILLENKDLEKLLMKFLDTKLK